MIYKINSNIMFDQQHYVSLETNTYILNDCQEGEAVFGSVRLSTWDQICKEHNVFHRILQYALFVSLGKPCMLRVLFLFYPAKDQPQLTFCMKQSKTVYPTVIKFIMYVFFLVLGTNRMSNKFNIKLPKNSCNEYFLESQIFQ